MDFVVLFTIEATNEAAQMSRGWTYWPRFVFQNFHGIVIVVALPIAGCFVLGENLITRRPDLPKSAMGLALVAAPIMAFWWFRRRDIRTATQMLAEINPLKLSFTSDGLHTFEKNGASNFMPWSGYDGFREERQVILLREATRREYRVIPRSTVPPGDVERMTSAIRSRLPEIH
jgi:hypothetical protein